MVDLRDLDLASAQLRVVCGSDRERAREAGGGLIGFGGEQLA